jgi:Putative polyhydroxyalkanoic acid system protein (PHA_gran_rgn)
MAKLNMLVPHALPHGEAFLRVQGEVENLKRQYGDKIGNLRDSWNNDTYVFKGVAQGFAVSGAIRVKPSEIEIAANLPWVAMPFKGRIEAAIRERLTSLLG